MNSRNIRLLNKLRAAHHRIVHHPPEACLPLQLSGERAGDAIRERLAGDAPTMVCRFGRTELLTIVRHLEVSDRASTLRKGLAYVRGRSGPFWWDEERRWSMCNLSGFFPSTDENLGRFAELMLNDMPLIDILGSWLPEESRVASRFPQALRVALPDLEPYLVSRPWSDVLEGKTVLIVHPFEKTITAQYQKREKIFPGRNVLPRFELITLRAVQSLTGARSDYPTWFDALQWMCDRISSLEFDVAIIGAGAYGMPLAAHVKRLGRKAVHLGGATQLLFGIRGKRWDDLPEFQRLFNDAWVRPSSEEVPENYLVVEQGAYW